MFDWDERKNAVNVRKHGISFERAKRIFENRVVTFDDDTMEYAEPREISIGHIDGVVFLLVVHTDRDGIISARRATRAERRRYEETV